VADCVSPTEPLNPYQYYIVGDGLGGDGRQVAAVQSILPAVLLIRIEEVFIWWRGLFF
jgi:hypothetical protein